MDNIDILMVSERNLILLFPMLNSSLMILDGVFLYIREDIPARMISTTPSNDLEGSFVGLNIRKKKFILCYIYYICATFITFKKVTSQVIYLLSGKH